MNAQDLIPQAVELGVLLVSLFAGGTLALRRIRREELRIRARPDPSTFDQAAFAVSVGVEVSRHNRELEGRVMQALKRMDRKIDRVAERVDELVDADAQHSARLDQVETGPITLDLDRYG